MSSIELNDKQIALLRPYERELRCAYVGDVALGISNHAADMMFGIYNEVFNDHLRNTGCGSCRLKVMKRLCRLYHESMSAESAAPKEEQKEEPKKTRKPRKAKEE